MVGEGVSLRYSLCNVIEVHMKHLRATAGAWRSLKGLKTPFSKNCSFTFRWGPL